MSRPAVHDSLKRMIKDRQHRQSHHGDSNPQRGFFKTPGIQSLKSITTFGGLVVTFSGIVLGVISGGSIQAAGVSTLGLLLTCCGHLLAKTIAIHQATDKAEDKERIQNLESRLDHLIRNPPQAMLLKYFLL